MTVVHVVVPDGIDDPARPSGGNTYDRRVCRGLSDAGWSVVEHPVPGAWPQPSPADLAALAAVVATVPDGAVLVVDGLVGSTAPDVLVPESRRLRLVALVHLPLGGPQDETASDRERAVLMAVAAVVTTSEWTRRELLDRHHLAPDRVHVAAPGVDAASPAPGTAGGGELLCVAAVTPVKGHDVLLTALGTLADLPWRCGCVGSLDRDAAFAAAVCRLTRESGLADRVSFSGPRTGADLDATYAAADLLVVASRAETYGMVVTEALARGIPVVATAVGGLPEALGCAPGGERPGLLVPPGDPVALAAALRRWLLDDHLRARLRSAALGRRPALPGWPSTSAAVARALVEVGR